MKTLISFGFKHGKPYPGAGFPIIDIRLRFKRNPWHNKALRSKRGDDPEVIADILKTPHFEDHFQDLKEAIERIDDYAVFIGCTGGRHRSVYLVNRLAEELGCQKTHRDYYKA